MLFVEKQRPLEGPPRRLVVIRAKLVETLSNKPLYLSFLAQEIHAVNLHATASVDTTSSGRESSRGCARCHRATPCSARSPSQSRRAGTFRTCADPDTSRTLPRAACEPESASASTPGHPRAGRRLSPRRSLQTQARPRTAQARAAPRPASCKTPSLPPDAERPELALCV